ncbi:hypothetical protein CRE_04182 [Caenorhabditis remanei]|uniref:Uncharacterized protein n=1 Tax=Caenorhabditis remanei TaxID=31234 RepID=E3MYV1_CAERE|nr:hypothetical protein CRE_04182 [Caenorhabditis remanei]
MDFKTRTFLQSTCRNERDRENQIYSVEKVADSILVKFSEESAPKTYSILVLPYIFSAVVVENFNFNFFDWKDGKRFPKVEKMIKKQQRPLRIQKFKTCGLNKFNIFFLRHCWNQIECIELNTQFWEISAGLAEAVKLEAVSIRALLHSFTTARMMRFSALNVMQGSFLFEKLIELDIAVGQQFKIANCLAGSRYFNPFPIDLRDRKWRSRVVARHKYTLLRIRTDNPDRHIFMATDPFESGFAYCTVIPAVLRTNQLKDYLYWA